MKEFWGGGDTGFYERGLEMGTSKLKTVPYRSVQVYPIHQKNVKIEVLRMGFLAF